jgi:hypothetical protein
VLIDNTIHFLKHLADNLLDENVVTATLSRRRYEVQFINKENCRRYSPRLREDVAYVAGGVADVQPFEVSCRSLDEPERAFVGDSARDLGFARACRTLKQNTCQDGHTSGSPTLGVFQYGAGSLESGPCVVAHNKAFPRGPGVNDWVGSGPDLTKDRNEIYRSSTLASQPLGQHRNVAARHPLHKGRSVGGECAFVTSLHQLLIENSDSALLVGRHQFEFHPEARQDSVINDLTAVRGADDPDTFLFTRELGKECVGDLLGDPIGVPRPPLAKDSVKLVDEEDTGLAPPGNLPKFANRYGALAKVGLLQRIYAGLGEGNPGCFSTFLR